MKFGRVIFDICQRTNRPTNKQTDRHADSNTSHPCLRRSDKTWPFVYHPRNLLFAKAVWFRVIETKSVSGKTQNLIQQKSIYQNLKRLIDSLFVNSRSPTVLRPCACSVNICGCIHSKWRLVHGRWYSFSLAEWSQVDCGKRVHGKYRKARLWAFGWNGQ